MAENIEAVLYGIVDAVYVLLIIAAVAFASREVFWRLRAWKNRRRHPALNRMYRSATLEAVQLLAVQRMIEADQYRTRVLGERGSQYPDLSDYHVPPGGQGFELARSQRKARQAERAQVRSKTISQ